eukprot:sb/3477691/
MLPPDLDDYIGHSRLLRKFSLDISLDTQPLSQCGYVGLRVVGGKNLGNKMVSKVVTVRLGSPADLRTSVKPGNTIYGHQVTLTTPYMGISRDIQHHIWASRDTIDR